MARTKTLTSVDWVKLAASKDPGRPVLEAIRVNGRVEATDGYRLHLGPNDGGLAEGLWHAKTGAKIEGTYPNTDIVLPKDRDNAKARIFADIDAAQAVCAAALAYWKVADRQSTAFVSLAAEDGQRAYYNAAFMADMLAGLANGPSKLDHKFTAPAPLLPLHMTIDGGRQGLLMPVRRHDGGYSAPVRVRPGTCEAADARFSLDQFVYKAA